MTESRAGQDHTQTSELIAPRGALRFGSAAVNPPGTVIAVGVPNTSLHRTIDASALYLYRKPTTGWAALPQTNARLNPPSPQKIGAFAVRRVCELPRCLPENSRPL